MLAAAIRTVLPAVLLAVASAPLAMSRRMASVLARRAASIRGVIPMTVFTSGSAPLSSSSRNTGMPFPNDAAWYTRVRPSTSLALILAPRSMRSRTFASS